MKKTLLFILCLISKTLWSQDATIVLDSAEYISKCWCEKSILKYKDRDHKQYHVFYSYNLDMFFILRKEREYFRFVEVKWERE